MVTSPLHEPYRRLDGLLDTVSVRPGPPGDGWLAGGWLGEPPVWGRLVAGEAARIAARQGRVPRDDVAALAAVSRYTWIACLAVVGPFLLARRVPRLAPADLWLPPGLDGFTAAPAAFACLADDPAAGHRDAAPVGGPSALRAALREVLAGHLGEVFRACGLRQGPRALWGLATDGLAAALWHVGRAAGGCDGAVAGEAWRVLPGATPPFVAGAGFRTVCPPGGPPVVTRVRQTCCLYYTAGGPECLTCPRLSEGERLRRLAADAVRA